MAAFRSKRPFRVAARVGWALLPALVGAGACGGSGAKSGAQDAAAGADHCASPGEAWTGCLCSANQPPGLRQCGTNHVWSACSCPPAGPPKCIEGQTVICDVCPGETEGRKTTCLRDSTYDCACQATGSAGTGGKPASESDAG